MLMYVEFVGCTMYLLLLYVMLIYVVAAAVLQWIDKRVVEALKVSLAERTVVQYSSQVTQFLLLSYGLMDPHLSYR